MDPRSSQSRSRPQNRAGRSNSAAAGASAARTTGTSFRLRSRRTDGPWPAPRSRRRTHCSPAAAARAPDARLRDDPRDPRAQRRRMGPSPAQSIDHSVAQRRGLITNDQDGKKVSSLTEAGRTAAQELASTKTAPWDEASTSAGEGHPACDTPSITC